MTANARSVSTLAPCPDAELLGAWAVGTLLESERAALESHLADCAECRGHAFSVSTELTPAVQVPVRQASGSPIPLRWTIAACAAAVVVALGIYLGQPTAEAPPASLEATLASLRVDQPRLFGTVVAVDPATLPSVSGATRGSMRVLTPMGLVPRSKAVTVRWTPHPGAQAYSVTHVDEDGQAIDAGDTTTPEWQIDPTSGGVAAGARTTLLIWAEGPGGTPLHRAPLTWASDDDEEWRTRLLDAVTAGRLPGGQLARVAAVHALAGRQFFDDALALAQTLATDVRESRDLAPLLEALVRRSEGASVPK